ncbi:MAG: glycoside hydrolase family 3 N-terminal domain-containing protein [Deltaproteobacteria bacterium]
MRILLVFTVFAMFASPAAAASPPQGRPHTDAVIEKAVDGLLRRMTLTEKIGQLHFPSLAFPQEPQLAAVERGEIGAMLNVVDPRFIRSFSGTARKSRLGIPMLFAIDAIYAFRITFPPPLAWAATWNPDLAELAAYEVGREARANGVNWTFAPMVDISRDPRWGRVVEGAGEDAFLGAQFAAARVRGYRRGGLATSVKHFVGYGAPEGGRDYTGSEISTPELLDRYLPPFTAALHAGSETVMASFNTINGVPVTMNRALVTDLLKKRLGFDGFVTSDFVAIGELVNHGVARDLEDASVLAFNAGIDFDMESGGYDRYLRRAVADGRVRMSDIDDAVRRVLRVKYRMGLFDQSPSDFENLPSPVDEAQVRRSARAVARESFVLLKNDRSTLPLTPATGRIALIGASAGSAIHDHSWYGPAQLPKPETETLREALQNRMRPGQMLTFTPAFRDVCGREFADKEGAIAAAKDADVIVYNVIEDCDMVGEGVSRTNLELTGRQQELLDALAATGKPLVLVVESGRPVILSKADRQADAILLAWLPGTEGRTALAEVLTGEVSPSGKLPMTFPRSVGQIPISYNRLPTGRPWTGDRYTSGYVDEAHTPLYPFGHGLSYTTFTYEKLVLSEPKMTTRGGIDVDVTVHNKGSRTASEVVQLYTRQLVASRSRPVKELRGFQKITLKPGESRTVRFRLEAQHLGFHDDAGRYLVEPGPFMVFAGGSSDTALRTDLLVTRE